MHFKCYKKFEMNCASRIYLNFLYHSFVVGTIFTCIYTLLTLIMMKFYCCILDDNLL